MIQWITCKLNLYLDHPFKFTMKHMKNRGKAISLIQARNTENNTPRAITKPLKKERRTESVCKLGLKQAVFPERPPTNTIIKNSFSQESKNTAVLYTGKNRIVVHQTRKPSKSLLTSHRRPDRFLHNLYKNLSGILTIYDIPRSNLESLKLTADEDS